MHRIASLPTEEPSENCPLISKNVNEKAKQEITNIIKLNFV